MKNVAKKRFYIEFLTQVNEQGAHFWFGLKSGETTGDKAFTDPLTSNLTLQKPSSSLPHNMSYFHTQPPSARAVSSRLFN